jgi:hypothetical protein
MVRSRKALEDEEVQEVLSSLSRRVLRLGKGFRGFRDGFPVKAGLNEWEAAPDQTAEEVIAQLQWVESARRALLLEGASLQDIVALEEDD